MLWSRLTNYIFPPKPLPKTNIVQNVTNKFISTNAAKTSEVITETKTVAPVVGTNAPPAAPEETITLEDAEARYVFTSYGGGLKLIELKNYKKSVGCLDGKKVAATELASLNTRAPVAAFTIISPEVGGPEGGYRLTKTGETVRAEKALTPTLNLIKEFRLSTNYLVHVSVRYENLADQPIRLPERELVIGTATPMSHHDESLTLGSQWFNGVRSESVSEVWFANRTMGCLPGSPRTIYQAGASNVIWGAVNNRFFTMVAVPEPGPAFQLVSRRIDLPPPTKEEIRDDSAVLQKPFGYQTAFVLAPVTIPAKNAFLQSSYQLYAGPKEYKTLSRLPKDMDQAMGFGRWFGFFAKALLLSMNGLRSLGIPYGLAIIVITVIIKLAFWPLTNASTKSMKRMSALQPQMKALQEKYKDDPQKMNTKLMEFMKEHKVNPLGGCLPMLLQIPVFIGFYQMLQSAIELRGASFLWACDLSQPDTVLMLGGFPINPLPLIMGGTMLWQASMTPPSPGMDPAQQKIMRYMPLMMVVFLYKFSAGLTLYWTVQNLLSIAQMKITKSRPEDDPAYKKTLPRPGLPPRKK